MTECTPSDDELYEQIAKRRYEYDYTSPWEHLAPTPRRLLAQAARNTMEPILARVRRDAARGALIGAEQYIRANMDEPYGDRAATRVADYARTHYPEETP